MLTPMLLPAEPPAMSVVQYDEPNVSAEFGQYVPLSVTPNGFALDRSTSGFDDSIDVVLSLMAFGPSTASHAMFVSEETARALRGSRPVQRVDPSLVTANLAEARRLSGFSLGNLADLVGKDRRTLHNWANGSAVRDRNAKRVADVLDVLRFIDRGSSEANAALLRKPFADGTVADLIASERYGDAKAVGGRGAGRGEQAWTEVSVDEIARFGPLPIGSGDADEVIESTEVTEASAPVRSRRRTVRRR